MSLVVLPADKINIKSNIQKDPNRCGHRGGKADPGEACVWLNAHKIRHGKADQKGLNQPLNHDPEGSLISVEVTHHTEENGGGNGLRSEPL